MNSRSTKSVVRKRSKNALTRHFAKLLKKIGTKEKFGSPEDPEVIEEFKQRIREGFYPRKSSRISLSRARKAINDFSQIGASSEKMAVLYLYYVECGVELTNDFGDIDEHFYGSLKKAFGYGLEYLSEENLLDQYKKQVKNIVSDTENLGLGFHDAVVKIYSEFYQR